MTPTLIIKMTKQCIGCGVVFNTNLNYKVYCTIKCREHHYNLAYYNDAKVDAGPIFKERIKLQNAIAYQNLAEKLKKEGTTIHLKRNKPRIEASWGSFIKVKIGQARRRAIRKRLEFSITPEFVMSLLIKQDYKCAILGWLLEHLTKSPASLSIDRIDSNKGYTEDNIQLVSAFANLGKRDFNQNEISKYLRK